MRQRSTSDDSSYFNEHPRRPTHRGVSPAPRAKRDVPPKEQSREKRFIGVDRRGQPRRSLAVALQLGVHHYLEWRVRREGSDIWVYVADLRRPDNLKLGVPLLDLVACGAIPSANPFSRARVTIAEGEELKAGREELNGSCLKGRHL
jgi:hypothetical protein